MSTHQSAAESRQPADDAVKTDLIRSEFALLGREVERQILGQSELVERLLIALLADGHLLVEGAPKLTKTKAVKALANGLEGDFHRIQFTPDLLPADLSGTEIYRPQDGSFRFDPGPVFHKLPLADEVHRAPAKVQSALLEAMGESQVTVGRETFPLPELFLVMAAQNLIEQEGTYPPPEAQLDRFLMHVRVDYPNLASEKAILYLHREEAKETSARPQHRVSQTSVFASRRAGEPADFWARPDAGGGRLRVYGAGGLTPRRASGPPLGRGQGRGRPLYSTPGGRSLGAAPVG